MKNYEKPMLIKTDELAEGVYLASGDGVADAEGTTATGYCQSEYMKGRYNATACQTCNNSTGDGVCQKKPPKNENQSKPTWEKLGGNPAENGVPQDYIDEYNAAHGTTNLPG